MDDVTKAEWIALAERLRVASPEKFNDVLRGLREVVEASEIIARFDQQLFFRGRPKKQYQA